MTRETKIGLLVGLAFILIVGILLSEHVTRSNEPPQANLVQAGTNVREGVATPGTAGSQPPITPIAAGQVQPRQPVPTQQDLRQPPAPVTEVVQLAPPGSVGPTAVAPRVEQPEPAAALASASASGNATVIEPAPVQPEPSPWDALAGVAAGHGEAIVAVNSRGNPSVASPRIETPPPAPVGTREYVAEPGDNLHKIALKTMGASTKANRDAIVRLNPSLQRSADRIIVGQRYLVPAVVGMQAAAGGTGHATRPSVQSPRPATSEPDRVAPFVLYEVQPGDSLWRIAIRHTGSPAGIKLIREMNADVLTSDGVRVGMKLKLPKPPAGQATARAN